jgi:phage tail sheath protein FI
MEAYDYHILITPDMPEQSVQDAALALSSFRKDFVYIVDSPSGLLFNEVIEWHNGTGAHGRTSALDSSYGILYWSWLKDYNPDTKEYVWCPPSVFIAEKLMEVDRLYGPWAAPAGDSRGKITAADYEHSPSFAQREQLYGDFNAVNPIVNFVSKGLEVYGQKTLIRENTSLNRVNVRRMIIFAKKLIKKALESIIFEPHNPDSWRKASNLVTGILEPIRQAGGIDQYSVVIDDTVNTPDVIAQNIMKGIIKIIPMNTIEIIEITMQVHKSGASLDE